MKYEDKTYKQWQANTFMGMMALLAMSNKFWARGIGRKVQVSMPGFPLLISIPQKRTKEEKARKKLLRKQRQARIATRGWA